MAEFWLRRGCSLASALLVVTAVLAADHAAAAPMTEIVITAFRRPVALDRSGTSLTVIRRDDIEQASAGSTVDLLRSVPGVTVSDAGGSGSESLVRLRGTEAQHTLVLIDGVRVNDPASRRNQFDFSVLDPADIERIEVLRGPQSALYGADAIGGVINIITRRPTADHRHSVTIEGGSYGTHREAVSLSGGIGNLRLLGSANYFHTDGFSRVGDRDHGEADGTDRLAGSLRGSYDFGGGSLLEFGANAVHQDSELDKSTSDNSLESARRDMVDGYARFSFRSHGIGHSMTGFTTYTTRHYVEDNKGTARLYDYRGSSVGGEYQGEIDLHEHGTLIAGARIEQIDAYQKRQDLPSPSFDDSRLFYAGFSLYSFTLFDHLDLSVGGRYDGQVDGDGFLTGRFTAAYTVANTGTRFHGSVGTGAKRPTAFQLSYNPALQTERSLGADLGVEQPFHDGRLLLSATAFYNRIEDMIDFDLAAFTYDNIAEAETRGVELAADAEIVPGVLSGRAAYTYLDARDLTTGLPLPRRARHSGELSLTYTGIDRLTTTLAARFVGPRYDDDDATDPLPGYVRVDLDGSYRVTSELSFFGRIENLFDANYHEVGDYNTPGLSAYLGLRWRN